MMNKEKYNLTYSQKKFLLFQLLNRKKSYLNICGSFTLYEKIDIERLEKAINNVVEANDALRTRICFSGLKFKQYFAKFEPIKVEVIDVKNDEEVKQIENTINHEVFSMINKPLFRIKIFRFEDGTGGIIGCMHHIICDAWTIGLCIDELMSYYYDEKITVERHSYSEYINREYEYPKTNRYLNDKEYWENIVANGIPQLTDMKGDLNQYDKARKVRK